MCNCIVVPAIIVVVILLISLYVKESFCCNDQLDFIENERAEKIFWGGSGDVMYYNLPADPRRSPPSVHPVYGSVPIKQMRFSPYYFVDASRYA